MLLRVGLWNRRCWSSPHCTYHTKWPQMLDTDHWNLTNPAKMMNNDSWNLVNTFQKLLDACRETSLIISHLLSLCLKKFYIRWIKLYSKFDELEISYLSFLCTRRRCSNSSTKLNNPLKQYCHVPSIYPDRQRDMGQRN